MKNLTEIWINLFGSLDHPETGEILRLNGPGLRVH